MVSQPLVASNLHRSLGGRSYIFRYAFSGSESAGSCSYGRLTSVVFKSARSSSSLASWRTSLTSSITKECKADSYGSCSICAASRSSNMAPDGSSQAFGGIVEW